MEARLAKIRWVGARYNGCTIKVGDLKFDLTIPIDEQNSIPYHMLYILRNGGGKGVFFQTLFQPLDPLTTWKKDKNTVNHFFYNHEEQPVYYTIHIVEEWRVSQYENLMIGISIAPKITNRKSKQGGGAVIEMEYILYTKKYDYRDEFNPFQLPLWDEETQDSIPLSSWKSYLKAQNEIQYYTMNDLQVYKEYLEENGLDSHSISILKEINEKEQTIEAFFHKSSDNHGLFYNLIIPTLNDQIEQIDTRNRDEFSIIESSFLETAKVSKELPELLKTINSIEELNLFIENILETYNKLLKNEQEITSLNKKGGEILFILEQILKQKEEQIQEDHEKLLQLENREKDLRWEKDNLGYMKIHKEIDCLEEEYEKMEEQKRVLDLKLNQISKERQQLEIAALLKKYVTANEELKSKQAQYKVLLQEDGSRPIELEKQKIEAYFNECWEEISEQWKNKMTLYNRTRIALEEKIERLESKYFQEDQHNRNISFEIRNLEEEIVQYNKKELEMLEQYGDSIHHLSITIEENEANVMKLKTQLQELEAESSAILENREKYILERAKLEKELEITNNQLEQLEKIREKQEAIEFDHLYDINNILKENFQQPLARYEYEQTLECLKKNKDNIEQKIRILEIEVANLENELKLIFWSGEKDFYVPNKELIDLYEKLKEHKIPTTFGTELLKSFPPSEREHMIKENPSLPYSLIIMEKDLKKENLSFLEEIEFKQHLILINAKDLNLEEPYESQNQSLYPISKSRYLPKNLAHLFASNENKWEEKKASVKADTENNLLELKAAKQTEQYIQETITRTRELLNTKLTIELEREYKQTIDKNKNIDTSIQSVTEAIFNLKEKLQFNQEKQNQVSEQIDLLQQHLKKFHKWNQECLKQKQRVKKLQQLGDELKASNQILKQINTQFKEVRNTLQLTISSYNDWYKFINKDLRTLKRMEATRQLPVPNKSNDFDRSKYEVLPSFGRSLSVDMYQKLKQYQLLDEELGNKNFQIAEFKAEINQFMNQVTELENQLIEKGFSQPKLEVGPQEDLLVIQEKLTKVQKELEEHKEENIKLEQKLSSIVEDIEKNQKAKVDLIRTIKADHEGREVVYNPSIQLEDEDERIRSDLKRNSLKQKETKERIKQFTDSKQEIKESCSPIRNRGIQPAAQLLHFNEEDYLAINKDSQTYVGNWEDQLINYEQEKLMYLKKVQKLKNQVYEYLQTNSEVPEQYSINLTNFLTKIENFTFEEAINSLMQYQKWAAHNIAEKQAHKEKAEDALNMWVERASRRVLELCNALYKTEKRMYFKNKKGIVFPLIKFEHKYRIPSSSEEIHSVIRDYALSKISFFVKKSNDEIDELSVQDIRKRVNISDIFLHALGDFPILKVYIPTIDGPLLRTEPRPSDYKSWEVINNGSERSSSKSGGQTLMAQFIVMAMIMRQRANDKSWLFLISDNPFGAMNAPELVESVFSLLELLKIQWIVVAPPIADVHITSSFNTLYHLTLEKIEGETYLTSRLAKNTRKYMDILTLSQDEVAEG